MSIQTVGIVGYGSFGALAHKLLARFAPRVRVRVFAHTQKADGKTFFELKDVAACDAIIFAVPIPAFEEVLKKALPLMREAAVIVDVATVKVHPVEVLKRLASKRRWLATHPMWGPESFEKRGGDIAGFRIVVAAHTLPAEQYENMRSLIASVGFDVVEMSPEAHDKHLAETLFLTHLIGQIVARGDFARTDIDTVSFGFLMDAVESVRHDEALFRDVYRFNPYCKDVLARFGKAEAAVRAMLEKSV